MRIDRDTVTQSFQSRSQDFVDNEIVAKSRRLDYEFFSRLFKVRCFVDKVKRLKGVTCRIFYNKNKYFCGQTQAEMRKRKHLSLFLSIGNETRNTAHTITHHLG